MSEVEQPIFIIAQHTRFLPEAERSADVIARASKRFKAVAAVLEERLKGRDFIVGNTFSAADVVLGGVLFFATRMGQLGDDTPSLKTYHDRLMARPAAKKGYAA
ncbi:glutathione binding-like protein [Hyalangium rubrum]|uniref:Glutathione binding-like protein n=1 Tax=Hyalangium rubrum TaxID=3103134 RepID=A0ABU5H0A6_9BACT|nr:glutathione binding-like protein [Hyalangium sp. s54d21]MDY7226726.1 glutathione binding-like protein [Hyalangium sp. s54d21]